MKRPSLWIRNSHCRPRSLFLSCLIYVSVVVRDVPNSICSQSNELMLDQDFRFNLINCNQFDSNPWLFLVFVRTNSVPPKRVQVLDSTGRQVHNDSTLVQAEGESITFTCAAFQGKSCSEMQINFCKFANQSKTGPSLAGNCFQTLKFIAFRSIVRKRWLLFALPEFNFTVFSVNAGKAQQSVGRRSSSSSSSLLSSLSTTGGWVMTMMMIKWDRPTIFGRKKAPSKYSIMKLKCHYWSES